VCEREREREEEEEEVLVVSFTLGKNKVPSGF